METYLLKSMSVFGLSLWKTYLGPALSAPYGFSYAEMLVFNVGAAVLSAAMTLRFRRQLNALIRQLLPGSAGEPRFRPELRRYLRFWKRYGFYGVMALTPVLIGIPLGVWISARLGTSKERVMIVVGLSSTIWASAAYFAARAGINVI